MSLKLCSSWASISSSVTLKLLPSTGKKMAMAKTDARQIAPDFIMVFFYCHRVFLSMVLRGNGDFLALHRALYTTLIGQLTACVVRQVSGNILIDLESEKLGDLMANRVYRENCSNGLNDSSKQENIWRSSSLQVDK